jgi:hypothetical protein
MVEGGTTVEADAENSNVAAEATFEFSAKPPYIRLSNQKP